MSKIAVQCKGSGQPARASINAKKANCGYCQKSVEVAPSNGRLRKHTRLTTTANLRKGR